MMQDKKDWTSSATASLGNGAAASGSAQGQVQRYPLHSMVQEKTTNCPCLLTWPAKLPPRHGPRPVTGTEPAGRARSSRPAAPIRSNEGPGCLDIWSKLLGPGLEAQRKPKTLPMRTYEVERQRTPGLCTARPALFRRLQTHKGPRLDVPWSGIKQVLVPKLCPKHVQGFHGTDRSIDQYRHGSQPPPDHHL